MNRCGLTACIFGAFCAALTGLAPVSALAETQKGPDDWRFLARIYGWFPSVDGDLRYSLPGGQESASVDASDILDALEGTFMGTFMASKSDWSLLTDVIYLKLANDKDNAISGSIPTKVRNAT